MKFFILGILLVHQLARVENVARAENLARAEENFDFAPTVNDGVFFTPRGSLSISNAIHVCFLEININTIMQNAHETIASLDYLATHIGYSKLSKMVMKDVSHMKDQLQHSINLMKATKVSMSMHVESGPFYVGRSKRGLVNAVGSAANYLFGTSTEAEIQYLNQEIANISAAENVIAHTINKHTSILKKMSPAVDALHSKMEHFQEALANFNIQMKDAEVRMELNFLFTRANLIINRITLLELGLTKLLRGKVAFEIIAESNFEELLNNIEHNGVSLLFSKNKRTITYASLSEVAPIRSESPGKLRFAILIPTERLQQPFHLYFLETEPVYNKTAKIAIEYQIQYPFFAVSQSLQSVALLKSLDNCRRVLQETWCPADSIQLVSSLRPVCENEIYFRRQPFKFCAKKL